MYFVQHGVSLQKEEDPDRPLSIPGRNEVERIAAYLRKVDINVKKIYHSGKTRAMETAQIFSDQIGDGNKFELAGMNPNDDVTEFAACLDDDEVMYVGHLPHLEKLTSLLIAGDEKAGIIKFTNGCVVCMERDDTGNHVKWFMIPATCKS
jgi:phosphohistidine phosphatase